MNALRIVYRLSGDGRSLVVAVRLSKDLVPDTRLSQTVCAFVELGFVADADDNKMRMLKLSIKESLGGLDTGMGCLDHLLRVR